MASLRWSICFGMVLFLAFTGVAYADSTYDYTGPLFNHLDISGPIGTQLTGTVTFGSAITPGFTGSAGSTTPGDILSWGLSDGVNTASSTSCCAGGTAFLDFTFSNGAITSWSIDASTSSLGFYYVEFLSGSPSQYSFSDIPGLTDASLFNSTLGVGATVYENYNTIASNTPSPGIWTLEGAPGPTPTPEPGTLALLCAGFIGVGGALRRRLHR